MKILIAPDKFKGSLSAVEVCQALKNGMLTSPDFGGEILARPLADGGDGSLDILQYYLDTETITLTVNDPLMRPIEASYLKKDKTAYIELAAASGIVLLKENEKNCLHTSTYGTGELMLDALKKGVQEIYLFIGGSATNDAAMGIAAALGYRFYDHSGQLLEPTGENLLLIDRIDDGQLVFDSEEVIFRVICDVKNPFYGKDGAAFTYAPQKGASESDVILLDRGLTNFANQLVRYEYPDIADRPGAGAAGGVGGGAMALLHAQLISGIDFFISLTQLEALVQDCDLIITGEGKLDVQTEQGKVINGVSSLARQHQKPIIAVCGSADVEVAKRMAIDKTYTVMDHATNLDDAIANASQILEKIGAQIIDDYR